MTTTTIPDYLTLAFRQLDAARAEHLENARMMNDTATAIARTAQQKKSLSRRAVVTRVNGARHFVPVVRC